MKLVIEFTDKYGSKKKIELETSWYDQTIIIERTRNDGQVEKKKISISKNNKLVIT